MKFQSYTLADDPFNFDLHWPFPADQRKVIEGAVARVELNGVQEVNQLERRLNSHLRRRGYLWDQEDRKACCLWLPDFRKSVDFINTELKIAIEVEKTEVKRILHDLLKFMNGSLTFVPKVSYGVLLYPSTYKRASGKESGFASRVRSEVPFYIKGLLPHTRLNDILFIVYEIP